MALAREVVSTVLSLNKDVCKVYIEGAKTVKEILATVSSNMIQDSMCDRLRQMSPQRWSTQAMIVPNILGNEG